MDKEVVVYVYNRIFLSHKKEHNNATCSNMDDIEIVILSEVRQRKTVSHNITHVWWFSC